MRPTEVGRGISHPLRRLWKVVGMNSLNEQRWPVMRTLVRDAYSAPLADDDLHAYLAQALPPITAGLASGARIALTAGSRGIDGYDRVLA